jgi:hypothetical protein
MSCKVIAKLDPMEKVGVLVRAGTETLVIEYTELPDALRPLKPVERKAYVEKQSEARKALDGRLTALIKQRDSYITAERAKQPSTKDSFDRVVEESLRKQMRRVLTD